MNAAEFQTELAKLVQGAVMAGLNAGQMDPLQLVACLEVTKLDLVRQFQDAQRAPAVPRIVPAASMPNNVRRP